MSIQAVSELRLRMIEDMKARQLNVHTQRSHIYSCKRFAAYLKRSPETATADEVRAFQLYLMETGPSICNRNRIMTGGEVSTAGHAAPARFSVRDLLCQGAAEATAGYEPG